MRRLTRLSLDRTDFVVMYVIAMHGLMFANLFIAPRFVSTLLLAPFAFVTVLLAIGYLIPKFVGGRPRMLPLDLAVTGYLLYSLTSLAFFATPGNPASPTAFFYGINLQVLPLLLYFVVRGIEPGGLTRILRTVVAAQAFCALLGVAMFLYRPAFYTEYVNTRLDLTEEWQTYSRLQSYMGSTAVGILCAASILLLAHLQVDRVLRYALALLFLLAILLTQQRGAYVSGVLASAYLVYRTRVGPLQLATALAAVAAGTVAGLTSLGLTTELLAEVFRKRVIEDLLLGDPLGERVGSYEKGLRFITEFPLGLGLGATTSAADDASAHLGGQVVDAYYLRIASDLGVVGLLLFITVLAVAFASYVRRPETHAFALVVVIYAIQSVGTNVLDSYYVSHVFWLSLGCVGLTYLPKWRPVAGAPLAFRRILVVEGKIDAR